MVLYSNDKSINIDSILNNTNNLKQLLVLYMNQISVAIDNIVNPADIGAIHTCLKNLKINLDNINNLISSLNTLKNTKENIAKTEDQDAGDYNSLYKETLDKYLKINFEVCTFITSLIQYTCIVFPECHQQEETSEILPTTTETSQTLEQEENTLIISEKNKNVILPYTLSELEEELKNNQQKYTSINDIIEKKYTISLEIYKNFSIARFKEAFKLMRNKEHRNIKDALDLGLELMFNYNLHPAIITACRNLDELDIYLDYLENGETNKFDCFKIIFDVAPTIVKSKRS